MYTDTVLPTTEFLVSNTAAVNELAIYYIDHTGTLVQCLVKYRRTY